MGDAEVTSHLHRRLPLHLDLLNQPRIVVRRPVDPGRDRIGDQPRRIQPPGDLADRVPGRLPCRAPRDSVADWAAGVAGFYAGGDEPL